MRNSKVCFLNSLMFIVFFLQFQEFNQLTKSPICALSYQTQELQTATAYIRSSKQLTLKNHSRRQFKLLGKLEIPFQLL